MLACGWGLGGNEERERGIKEGERKGEKERGGEGEREEERERGREEERG